MTESISQIASLEPKLTDLEDTINELQKRIKENPDPFLIELLSKLSTIQENQQQTLVQKAIKSKRNKGGFKGFGRP